MEFPRRPTPRPRAKYENVQANISPELAEAVRAACAAHGLTLKAAVVYGLEAFLEHAARIPPDKRRA